MKKNIFLSILFLIFTTFASMHKAHHIYTQDSVDCEKCIVVKNLHNPDIDIQSGYVTNILFDKIYKNILVSHKQCVKILLRSRAPPINS